MPRNHHRGKALAPYPAKAGSGMTRLSPSPQGRGWPRSVRGGALILFATAAPALGIGPTHAVATTLERFDVVGDAIPSPLGGHKGDARRGREIVLDRRTGNCLICHRLPIKDEPFQGEIGPSLAGIGSRLSDGQIRLRLVDESQINPNTLMPPYYRMTDLNRVAPEYEGSPALDAGQIEDVVAYLSSLKE